MALEIFLFWLSGLCLLQLGWAVTLSFFLATVWVLVLCLVLVLFIQDLDLLASALLAVYSSVFLFLTLLTTHLAPYNAPAFGGKPSLLPNLLFLVAAVLSVVTPTPSAPSLFPGLDFHVPTSWHQFYALLADPSHLATTLLHWGFYRFFAAETVLINLYLFLGLLAVTALLALLQVGGAEASGRALATRGRLGRSASLQTSRIWLTANFRRQTRRKNNSITRHKL